MTKTIGNISIFKIYELLHSTKKPLMINTAEIAHKDGFSFLRSLPNQYDVFNAVENDTHLLLSKPLACANLNHSCTGLKDGFCSMTKSSCVFQTEINDTF